jgi:hypothetical protein
MQLDDDTGLYLPPRRGIDLFEEVGDDDFDEEDCFYPATPLEYFRDWRRVSKLGELGQDWLSGAENS